jgi:hypothetical protein
MTSPMCALFASTVRFDDDDDDDDVMMMMMIRLPIIIVFLQCRDPSRSTRLISISLDAIDFDLTRRDFDFDLARRD